MQKGIDVSYAQGKINWEMAASDGVQFAMIKASQGKLLRDASVGPFADPKFEENIKGAHAAGIKVGVYHYLCAGTVSEALKEAQFVIDLIKPYRDIITLGVACDAEEDKYLPRDRQLLTNIVHGFCKKIKQHGKMQPMLYSNPNYLTYRLGNLSIYPLWLAYWGTTEARAKRYNPRIWQYGTEKVSWISGSKVDVNIGYF